jgi:hypothetical protein
MKDLHFKDIADWLKQDIKLDSWIILYKDMRLDTDWFNVFCVLFPQSLKKDFLAHGAWSLNETQFRPGYAHYADKAPKYFRWGLDVKYEPFVYQCFYNNLYPTKLNIIEEFIQYFNLFHDIKTNTYISINESSEENTVIAVTDDEIKVKTVQLREFLSAKKMHLGLQFDYYRFSDLDLIKHGLSENDYFEDKGKDFCYDITFQKSDYLGDKLRKSNSRFLGKKIIENFSDFKPKLWTEQFKNKENEKFIIAVDGNSGENIEHTCNPDFLSNFFGKNPEAPHYLTPVFFRREVLLKYYQDTRKHSVNDGCIEFKGSWRLEIDNDQNDSIMTYLGDLGRDLPYAEQKYWRSFNIPPNGKISEVKFERDFLTISSSPQSRDLVFKTKLGRFKKDWLNKFGFSLYLDLSEEDSHCLNSIRIPLYDNNTEFDNLILNLAKVLIDYLNEKEIVRRIEVDKSDIPGITKLEILLEKSNPYPQNAIPFLRDLQSLRSKGAAHQKGRGYQKQLKKMHLENKSLIVAYGVILEKAICLLDELNEIIKSPHPNILF